MNKHRTWCFQFCSVENYNGKRRRGRERERKNEKESERERENKPYMMLHIYSILYYVCVAYVLMLFARVYLCAFCRLLCQKYDTNEAVNAVRSTWASIFFHNIYYYIFYIFCTYTEHQIIFGSMFVAMQVDGCVSGNLRRSLLIHSLI